MSYTKEYDRDGRYAELQDQLVKELQMIVGWGDWFSVKRHPIGVSVEAERLPAGALALQDQMVPGPRVVDVRHCYEDADDPTTARVKVTFGWL